MEVSLRVPELENWYYRELWRLYDNVPARKEGFFVVMGCPIWGQEFVREFVNWCVPSILEPTSMAALTGCCRLVIMAAAADRLPLLQSLKAFDYRIEIQIIEIPEDALKLAVNHPQHKLFLLGAAHKIVLQIASRLGAGFHFLMPDHVHGVGYYSRFREFAKRKEAIAQCGFSAAREQAQADMAMFRNSDGTLSIPQRMLGDIVWRNLHPHHRANLMKRNSVPDNMPRTQLMLWRGRRCLVAHSCRPNPIWLSPRLTARVPVDFQRPATLDTETPILAPSGCYTTQASDGMAAVELTPLQDKQVDENKAKFGDFARRALNEARYSDRYLQLLGKRTELALSEEDPSAMTDDEIAADVNQVVAMLLKERPELATRLLQRISSAPETLSGPVT